LSALKPYDFNSNLKLYRRQQILTKNLALFFFLFSDLKVYNGYDFLKTPFSSSDVVEDTNLGSYFFTREQSVKHKQKISKAAKRTLQLRTAKKKTSVLTKKGLKAKKIIKKK
jgi:hypothetical protein